MVPWPSQTLRILSQCILPTDGHCKPVSLRPVDAGLADAAFAFLRKLLIGLHYGGHRSQSIVSSDLEADGFVETQLSENS